MIVRWFSILSFIVFYSYDGIGQLDDYQYRQSLGGVVEEWHSVVLSDNIYENVKRDLSDIRIIGITNTGDTVVAPYILNSTEDKITRKQVSYNRRNSSKKGEGYYTTFSMDENIPVDNIKLDFKTKNFDWKVQLEGSMDQREWFTILSDYRIVGINKAGAKYQYSNLLFPESTYKHYRLFVPSEFDPGLNTASISKQIVENGDYRSYDNVQMEVAISDNKKSTIIDLTLPNRLTASRVDINVKDQFDYYRPLEVQYLRDSFQTDKGWKYQYETLTKTTLSSFGDQRIDFPTTITDKIRLVIVNGYNQPLDIDMVSVSGSRHVLTARFSGAASYFLLYGNETARKPTYDIERFEENIPEDLKLLQIGTSQYIGKAPAESSPLIKSKLWLWLVMGLAILLMGWFTLAMIRGKE